MTRNSNGRPDSSLSIVRDERKVRLASIEGRHFSESIPVSRSAGRKSRERVQSYILPAARKNCGLPPWLHRTAPSWVMILPGPTHPIDHRPRRDSYARNHLERARARALALAREESGAASPLLSSSFRCLRSE